jgi:hypothetical protein
VTRIIRAIQALRYRTGPHVLRELAHERRAVAAVEFALVLTPLLMLLFGFIATASIFFSMSTMQNNAHRSNKEPEHRANHHRQQYRNGCMLQFSDFHRGRVLRVYRIAELGARDRDGHRKLLHAERFSDPVCQRSGGRAC